MTITGVGGSGVLLSDAVVDNGRSLMKLPSDLDAAFRKSIPPFRASGSPVDVVGAKYQAGARCRIALTGESSVCARFSVPPSRVVFASKN